MNGDLAFKIKIPAKTIDKLVKIIKKFLCNFTFIRW